MSDTENTTIEQPTDETEPHGAEIDWKAEARKWESRAKANKEAADELAALKASQMTETEKLQKRVQDAEALVTQYQQREQHDKDANEVATSTGVPYSLLAHCGTREDMEQFAREYAQETHVTSAPPAPGSRIVRSDGASGISPKDAFAQYMEQLRR